MSGEVKKTIVYYNQQTRRRKRRVEGGKLLFVDCNRGFCVAAFFPFLFFLAALCVYRLNKIQMSESTREGPLSCIHNQSTFAFFSAAALKLSLHGTTAAHFLPITICYVYVLNTTATTTTMCIAVAIFSVFSQRSLACSHPVC